MIFQKGELKYLWPFYTYYFLNGLFGMIMPFLIVYFRDIHLSFFQISIILAVFSVSTVLFEIPTGVVADRWSRKNSVIIGLVITGMSVLCVALTESFFVICMLYALIGIGTTFMSGAEEAWVVDKLNYHKKNVLQQEYFIKIRSLNAVAQVLAPLIGAYVVLYFSIQPLWYFWGIGFLIGVPLLLFIKEEYVPYKNKQKQKKTFRKSLKYIVSHKQLFSFVIALVFLYAMTLDFDYWQPLLIDLTMPIYLLGIIYSGISFLRIFTPFAARYFNKYKPKNVMLFLTVARMLILWFTILLYPPFFMWGICIFVLGAMTPSLYGPIENDYFQKQVPKQIRATITSIQRMVTEFGILVSGLGFGYLADLVSLTIVIPIIGSLGIFAVWFLLHSK